MFPLPECFDKNCAALYIFSILNCREKPQGKAADDYIPDVPDENAAAGVLPTEIRKLIEARKEVKKLLNNPNLTDDNLR